MAIDTWQALEAIEQAQRERPFCACGQPTRAVVRDGAAWLECASLQGRASGRIARAVAGFGPVEHARRPIVDLEAAAA